MSARPATPPTTPPAIAPTLLLDPPDVSEAPVDWATGFELVAVAPGADVRDTGVGICDDTMNEARVSIFS